METRNYYYDNVKFFLICMVILGHCIARLGGGDVENAIDASVYFFHMPLFIFISGLFSKKTVFPKFRKSIVKLIEALIIFEILHIILRMALFDYRLSMSTLVVPQWSLWYLLSLIFWRIIVQLFSVSPRGVSLGVVVLIGLIAGFVPLNGPFSFQRTCSLMPFFILGYICARDKLDIFFIERIPRAIAIGVVVLLPICVYHIDFPFKEFLEGVYSYHKFAYPLWFSVLMRLLLYICCFIVSVCVLRLVPQKKVAWISEQGANTLLYYLYHTLIIYMLIKLKDYFSLPTSFVAVISYVIIIILIIWCLSNMSFFRILPNFFSHYKNKVKAL